MNIACEYCGREQAKENLRCEACGAPLPVPKPIPARVTYIEESTPAATVTTPTEPLVSADHLKEGLAAAGDVVGSLGIGAVVLRLVAETVAITFSALIIGFNSGTYAAGLNHYLPYLLLGLAGGALMGICVVLARKRTLPALVSAPAGALLGTLLVLLLPDTTSHFPMGTLAAIALGALFAVIGKRSPRKLPLRCLTLAHPILGAISGILFALLGFFITYRIY